MPMHDWTRVDVSIYHSFQLDWLSEISRSLNRHALPSDHYALIDYPAAGGRPSIAVRHVSGDRIVATIEIVSPEDKNSEDAWNASLRKTGGLLERRIHLLLIDPFLPGPRDPDGIHAAVWSQIDGDPFRPPADRPLTLAAYECDLTTRAYVETIAVGDPVPDMPLFLEPEAYVTVPLEATYQAAWDTVPARWKRVVAPSERQ